VWIFFAGYVALFWAVSLQVSFVVNWHPPAELRVLGTQIAILLAMLALYRSAPIPEILGKEVEMEELSLDFDERLVKQTVEQYVESGEFESIRTQLDIAGMQELSDKDMHDIIGPDLEKVLPLRKIPGIGARMEERLREAGYESAAQLAGETPQRLSSKVKGLSESQAAKILANVRGAVKEAMKKPDKSSERKRS
jgi:DNA polymerase/3'-5' exonuclease PolX